MPTVPLPDAVAALLARPNPAVMATLRADGQPVTVATWYLLEDDGRVLLASTPSARGCATFGGTPGSR